MADFEERDPITGAAEETATRHQLTGLLAKSAPLPAWTHLEAMKGWLTRARNSAVNAEKHASAAAEWLLDNDYQIQRAILQIREDLPREFYAKLPGLSADGLGRPRVHQLAHAMFHASHLQISLNTAVQFVEEYQTKMPLSIAETWAFPTMLRIVCLELLVAGFTRLFPDVAPPFQLSDTPDAATIAFDDTECVARAIANLGVIATIQWNDFFDRTSQVEAILRRDPAGVYPRMDFDTRDRYRHAVEQLAEQSGLPEWEVAQRALRQCHSSDETPSGHVGFWLVDTGRSPFADTIDPRPWTLGSMLRRALRYRGVLYALGLLLAGLAAFALPATYLASTDASPKSWLLGIALTLLPASVLSITFVNWLVTLITPPRVLPKLEFRKGIPKDCATAVIVPVLVARAADIAPLLQRLEAHRLGNSDTALEFVLLSDFADAATPTLPTDPEIERALVAGIEELNARYANAKGHGPFHLLHRPRTFNESQGCWMGWERKRGKLEQFNGFILRGDATPFSITAGKTERLRRCRFVMTADADTRLPSGVVRRLVGTLAHPLNRAHFAPETGAVERGYTVLQPRVELAPEATGQSLFARFYGGDTTIDIYSRAVSDVYQDLLGTGVFVGKGLYEVAAFERSLEGRIPENTLLSHDLFEGLHGRAALVSDVIVYEGFPTGYLDFASRWHRWVRGDWQILAWLFPFVPGRDGRWLRNRLGWFDRLKIFDNLRRSLVPASILALLLGGWFLLTGQPWVWTLLAVVAPGAYLFTDLVTGFAQGRRRGVMQRVLRRLTDHLGRWLLAIAFLVSDAVLALHAIAVTLWRLRSGRHRLEWTSAAHMATRNAARHPRFAAWRDMAASPLLALLIAGGLIAASPGSIPVAAPLLLLWFIAPEIAIWISRPLQPSEEEISEADRKFLRLVARRTWLFFETFVRPEDNWLPPDNYQEPPDEDIAHRTSPTNIGMMIVSVLTAWRLGHIGLNEVATRLRNTLDALDRLERYRGHILNWYETRTLAALEPRYVSTVDSGNLAVSLITVAQALREARSAPPVSADLWRGLEDNINLLAEAIGAIELDAASAAGTILETMRETAERVAENEPEWIWGIDDLVSGDLPRLREQVALMASDILEKDIAALRDIQAWLERLDHHLSSMRRDLRIFSPWWEIIANHPADCVEMAGKVADLMIGPAATQAINAIDIFRERTAPGPSQEWANEVRAAIEQGQAAARELHDRLDGLSRRADADAHAMDFSLLFDTGSRLFHIGYNVSADRIDPHHYDLLASEARLASYFAIAKGDIAPSHWFHLGRPITKQHAGLALVSWNGSMFEYLMPNIFLHSDPGTLLGMSDRTAIAIQIAFGQAHDIPWGISESSFASMGQDRVYRYHAFGVPALGLQRGLGRDLVVSPYATALALTIRPAVATRNLKALAELGLVGRYGFFEALDFTPERLPRSERFALVRSYMAHHHGMSLAALGNALCDDMLVRWFHADPYIRTVDLLLNERIPWELPPEIARIEVREPPSEPEGAIPGLHSWVPIRRHGEHAWQILGNGRLSSRIRSDGAGGLGWNQHALTRMDTGDGDAGFRIYLRDLEGGDLWSPTGGPLPQSDEPAEVVFHAHQVEFHRRTQGLSATTMINVANGDDLEIRRLTLVNEEDRPRTIEVTGYAEIVLAPAQDAARHPAFSKMFVGAEALPGSDGLLFTRRPRNPAERPPVMLSRVIGDDDGLTLLGLEGDRRVFLGRHGQVAHPAAMNEERLAGTLGWTLDPVCAIRVAVELPPLGRRELAFLTIAAGSRQSALDIADRFTTLPSLDWAVSDTATAAAREMHGIGLQPHLVPQAQALLSHLLTARSIPAPADSRPFRRGDLWALGISGDHPILLLRAGTAEQTGMIRLMLAVHRLLRQRGMPIDLVIAHEGTSGYIEPVRERLLEVLRETGVQDRLGTHGGIHLVGIGPSDADRAALLERVARLILEEEGGTLAEQLARRDLPPHPGPPFTPVGAYTPPSPTAALARPADLQFDNGWGGFAPDSGDYVIHLEPGAPTPAPWSNVLANDAAGTIVTEGGLGFTWAVNSGENRLTPWFNDPVEDPQGERLYLRDEENARLWTPTPLPAGQDSACRIHHSPDRTTWHRHSEGLEQELSVFVPLADPVKLIRLRLRNQTAHARRITATYYAEWLLGAVQGEQAPLRTSRYDPGSHAILGQNPWTDEFCDRVAFLTTTLPVHSLTTSRRDFHGARPDAARPAGLLNWDLGNRQEAAGDDCCAALQVHLDIPPEGEAEVCFLLGQGDDLDHARALVRHWQEPSVIEAAARDCAAAWTARLSAVQVKTPDPAFDLMVNRWLPHQSVSSRVRARAGFYQASGAFGFRDQLQDVLAQIQVDPTATRKHILAAAAHQFEEGDVLHWWHPPSDRGVRTRCSDDLVWLPYAVAHYVEATGDKTILAEEIPFLRAPPLAADETDRYARFEVSDYTQPLFVHCDRALSHAYRFGPHGLPLIGTGDWNDGMDRVGNRGHGESVWLAWFIIATIRNFTRHCVDEDQIEFRDRWNGRADSLAAAVERSGWDGEWYLRAFDDDGRPWGTAEEQECRIDSIAQSWSVLSGTGDAARARTALASARRFLVREDDNLVRLLDPPFDRTPREPGYIKAYPPGIRENGGQYTHAATWLAIAFARMGNGDGAKSLFDRINPILHAPNRQSAEHYRSEPYVVAADIAGVAPHLGRGGWTWYTGAAAWAWRLAVEEILGVRLVGGQLQVRPALPKDWPRADLTLQQPRGAIHVTIETDPSLGAEDLQISVDGIIWSGAGIPFPDDRSTRAVIVRVPPRT
ncbi:GH36-type glycosyl hydrolase domain-containing protein [Novosphingobium album (ex Liu et al. 2023)]|uniref:Glucoamylase family protein n=1 Tax=Novosphingobium album (ex Liu et al. 2023) TaxID=3031130 RepID=A0ABT5WS43_9SPHN|nr:glucoamylase family protein [Novosphingobium album (ex Liu et al. 2023)]MDE8652867.1 glucoamylase family protein [Novosphingobium album (ex Liu et al. 2023)]